MTSSVVGESVTGEIVVVSKSVVVDVVLSVVNNADSVVGTSVTAVVVGDKDGELVGPCDDGYVGDSEVVHSVVVIVDVGSV